MLSVHTCSKVFAAMSVFIIDYAMKRMLSERSDLFRKYCLDIVSGSINVTSDDADVSLVGRS